MASLLSPRRSRSAIALSATEARDETTEPGPEDPRPSSAWLLAAVAGALVAAVSGWVLVSGLAVVGWLAADPGTLGQALRVGTELWLLSNGAGARLGDTSVSLVPWGVTLVIAVMVFHAAGFAARQGRDRPGATAVAVTVVMTVAYLAPVTVTAMLLDHPVGALRGALTMAAVVAVAAGWGSCRAIGHRPTAAWPAWSRAVPRGVLAAQLVLLTVGAGVLVTSAVLHLEQIEHLLTALRPGLAGNIALLLLQLAYAPNAVVWSSAYALGAGFTVGPGTAVAPAGTQLGLLPAVPLLGALPGTGPGDERLLWFLAGGVLAGVVAAVVVVLARPGARFDESALVGGLAGSVGGLVFVGVAWLSGGDLGIERLTDLGPRLVPLTVMAVVTLGVSGTLTGLVLGLGRLVRRRGR